MLKVLGIRGYVFSTPLQVVVHLSWVIGCSGGVYIIEPDKVASRRGILSSITEAERWILCKTNNPELQPKCRRY